jgi:hypothetical protein
MRVAALDPDDKVALKQVVVGRNLGNKVQIEAGLLPSDRLVDNPLESIQTGDKVNVANPDPNMIARDIKAAPNKPPSL